MVIKTMVVTLQMMDSEIESYGNACSGNWLAGIVTGVVRGKVQVVPANAAEQQSYPSDRYEKAYPIEDP